MQSHSITEILSGSSGFFTVEVEGRGGKVRKVNDRVYRPNRHSFRNQKVLSIRAGGKVWKPIPNGSGKFREIVLEGKEASAEPSFTTVRGGRRLNFASGTEILVALENGTKLPQVMADYGVSKETVQKIASGQLLPSVRAARLKVYGGLGSKGYDRLIRYQRGTKRLSDEDYIKAFNMYFKQNVKQRAIAKKLKVSDGMISAVLTGRMRPHLRKAYMASLRGEAA